MLHYFRSLDNPCLGTPFGVPQAKNRLSDDSALSFSCDQSSTKGFTLDFDAPLTVILLVVLPLGLSAGTAADHAALPVVFFAFALTVEPVQVIVLFVDGSALGDRYAPGCGHDKKCKALSWAVKDAQTSCCETHFQNRVWFSHHEEHEEHEETRTKTES